MPDRRGFLGAVAALVAAPWRALKPLHPAYWDPNWLPKDLFGSPVFWYERKLLETLNEQRIIMALPPRFGKNYVAQMHAGQLRRYLEDIEHERTTGQGAPPSIQGEDGEAPDLLSMAPDEEALPEEGGEVNLYYISFCDPMKWRGAVFIETEGGVVDAQKAADDQGISPQDVETLAFRYDTLDGVPNVPDHMRNRLLSEEELLAFWPDAADVMSYQDHVPE